MSKREYLDCLWAPLAGCIPMVGVVILVQRVTAGILSTATGLLV